MSTNGELVEVTAAADEHVAVVRIRKPPTNYLDIAVLRALVAAMTDLDADPSCRAVVVRSEGKHFCAGRDFGATRTEDDTSANVYRTATALLGLGTPWVAELTGGSIGAGMGLAACADLRVAAGTAYLSANFVRLGLHHGFGLTATLPRLVGPHRAAELLAGGRRVGATEAHRIGLVDVVANDDDVAKVAYEQAAALAALPPLATASVRATMRAGLAEAFTDAVALELREQQALIGTADFREAAVAARERRPGKFSGI